MIQKENNFAFIDSNNLHLSIKQLGWKLDFKRFRKYLMEKYGVQKAYMFIGYFDKNQDMYTKLQEVGYILIFKPTLAGKDGYIKGNCDAELVLHTMIEYENYNKAVIVTGDGDFHCLVQHLIKNNKFKKLLIPSQSAYSALLKRFPSGYLAFVSDVRKKVEYLNIESIKRKEPHKDKTL